jgi:hypothetical protein
MAEYTRREVLKLGQKEGVSVKERPGLTCHFVWQSSHEKLLPTSLLPTGVDSFCLEPAPGVVNPETRKTHFVLSEDEENITPCLVEGVGVYQKWLPMIKDQGAEIIVGDFSAGFYDRFLSRFVQAAETFSGAMVGLGTTVIMLSSLRDRMLSLGQSNEQARKLNRRSFLKLGAGIGGLAASTWLISETSADFLRRFGDKSEALGKVTDGLAKLSSHAHPEDLLVYFRNLVNASKLGVLAEENKRANKQGESVVSFGNGHIAMEDLFVLGPGLCCAMLDKIYPPVIFKQVTRDYQSSVDIAAILRFSWDKEAKRWQAGQKSRDDRLAKLIQKKISLAD